MKRITSIWYSEKYHEQWSLRRRYGFVAYVLRYGVLIFSLSTLLMFVVIHLLEGNISRLPSWINLFLWCGLSGLVFGTLSWLFSEWHYHQYFLE